MKRLNVLEQIGLFPVSLICVVIIWFFTACENEREANISEYNKVITTYTYGDPSTIPLVASSGDLQRKTYPYFSFDGYSHEGVDKSWRVIRLKNEYIELTILPEVGGKIWGAKEISTGKEFIYKNSVKKFRDIALRGPWTSGGIEFIFSSYGHPPWSAAPVDYLIRKNEDGSVSAVVGGLDLTSRNEWRVTITLPKDKAYFQTESFYYNPTPLIHRDVTWLNTAVKATDDLQFFYPGQYQAGHQGDVGLWPIDEEGRDLSFYRNNNFGSHKSYHVFGKKSEFFGGYWHDEDFGFGNWSHYNDMPGKKIWLWALSRAGGIWEDLLTDTDGQYVEVQSGRHLNQPQGRSIETPFYHDAFYPWTSNRWEELWFPVKKIGGIKAASRHAVLNLEKNGHQAIIALMALESVKDNLEITVGDELASNHMISIEPLEVYFDTLEIADPSVNVRVELGNRMLIYDSHKVAGMVDRPIENELSFPPQTPSEHYRMGWNHLAHASFGEAMESFYTTIDKDPAYSAAYVGLADLYFRMGEYKKALEYVKEALSHNTYDADANQIYGVIKDRIGKTVKALEAYGWAARSPKYRSGAYASMAELYLKTDRPGKAEVYANRSLESDRQNINAYKALAISYRMQQKLQKALPVLETILDLDPLNHFARFEQFILEPKDSRFEAFASHIRNELPHETYLELAVYYEKLGLDNDAITLLQQWSRQPERFDLYKGMAEDDLSRMQRASSNPMIYYWLAYLQREHSPQESRNYLERAVSASPYLNFPFRLESIPVLKWANEQNSSWKNNYYLGLIYWHAGRKDESLRLFHRLGETPDYAPFYLTRGLLRDELNDSDHAILRDFKIAQELDPGEWRTWNELINFFLAVGDHPATVSYAERAFKKFPGVNGIEMSYANALLYNQQYKASVNLLEQISILPSEHARGSRIAYERATIFTALEKIHGGQFEEALQYIEKAKTWPNNLGIGEPFDPDVRLQNFLAAYVHKQMGNPVRADKLYEKVIDYTEEFPNRWGGGHYAGILALEKKGEHSRAGLWLQKWQDAQPENPTLQWAVAHFNNDLQTTDRLMGQNINNLTFRLQAEALGIADESAANQN